MSLLQIAVMQFLTKVDTGWAIHHSHLDAMRQATTEPALKSATAAFLQKVDETSMVIHASHLQPLRDALQTEQDGMFPGAQYGGTYVYGQRDCYVSQADVETFKALYGVVSPPQDIAHDLQCSAS